MHRRQLLEGIGLAGAYALAGGEQRAAGAQPDATTSIIDSNLHLFYWPFRRLPLDETKSLVEKLRALGIGEAWAGSFEALLHRDLTAVNERLAEECAAFPELRPVGAINLQLPDWQTDLDRCLNRHRMHAVRLYPSYHGYQLDDHRLRKLASQVADAGAVLQLVVALEDPRTQHPGWQVADLSFTPVPSWMGAAGSPKVQLLGGRWKPTQANVLSELYLDTSRIEGTDGIAQLLETFPAERLLFGSHAPFLIPEASLIRIAENRLRETDISTILSGAAKELSSSQRDRR